MSHDTPLIEVLAEPSRLSEHLRCGNVRNVKPEFQVLRPTPYRAFPGTEDPVTLPAEPCGSACLANVARRPTTNLSNPRGRSGVSASGAQPTTVATIKSTHFTVQPEPLSSACTAATSSNSSSSTSKAARLPMPARCIFNPLSNAQLAMTASVAGTAPAVEVLTQNISVFSDLFCIGNEWICGDDNFNDEIHDKMLCEAIWGGPQCVPPRMTYPGGPCQVPQCCHGHARPQFNGWFCHEHCMRLQVGLPRIRQPLKDANMHQDFWMEFVYRVQEMMCRQHTDKGHWQRLCNLARRAPLGQFCSCLAVLSKLCDDFSTFQDPHVLTTLCVTSGLLLDHPCFQNSRDPEDTCGSILHFGCMNPLEMLC